MSKLTEEQKLLISDNHKLIYWYASLKRLDINEYYDLLALELCYAVQRFNPKKGSLSSYYKRRCDWLLHTEYIKSFSNKRKHTETVYMEELHHQPDTDTLDTILIREAILKIDTEGILRMKMEGYNQQEIADKLGVSQSHISNELKRLREEYNEING